MSLHGEGLVKLRMVACWATLSSVVQDAAQAAATVTCQAATDSLHPSSAVVKQEEVTSSELGVLEAAPSEAPAAILTTAAGEGPAAKRAKHADGAEPDANTLPVASPAPPAPASDVRGGSFLDIQPFKLPTSLVSTYCHHCDESAWAHLGHTVCQRYEPACWV